MLLRHHRQREPDRDYIGIARGQLPQKAYYGAWRTFPDTCDWSWQETRPVGETRTYFGVNVFEGAYPYARHARHAVAGAAACSRP